MCVRVCVCAGGAHSTCMEESCGMIAYLQNFNNTSCGKNISIEVLQLFDRFDRSGIFVYFLNS